MNKPTNTLLFNKINEILEDNNQVPDILDYRLPGELKEITTYSFSSSYSLDYGGSEGIYLSHFIEGQLNFEQKDLKRVEVGCYKTLLTDDESMRKMGILAANITLATYKYLSSHLDDFTWEGTDVTAYDVNDKMVSGYTCGKKDDALREITKLGSREKTSYVILRDNATREEKRFTRQEALDYEVS